MKAVLVGWFNKKNLGDDVIYSIASVLLKNYSVIDEVNYIAIDKINSKDNINIITEADFVILGPGGLINKGCAYIIPPLKLAKKIFIFGLSIEDYTGSSDKVIDFLSKKAHIALLRDSDSFFYYKKFNPRGQVFEVNDLYHSFYYESFPNQITKKMENNTIAIPREWKNKTFNNSLMKRFVGSSKFSVIFQDRNIIDMCRVSDKMFVIDSNDDKVFDFISNHLGKEYIGIIDCIDDFRIAVQDSNVISARFHATLISLMNGVFVESFCYQNKLENLARKYKLPMFNYSHSDVICLDSFKQDGCNSLEIIKSILGDL